MPILNLKISAQPSRELVTDVSEILLDATMRILLAFQRGA